MEEINLDYRLAEELLTQIKEDEMGAWFDLPNTPASSLKTLETLAEEVRSLGSVLVCIGIGGSYLGTRAVYEALSPLSGSPHPGIKLLFAGNSLSSFELKRVLADLDDADFCINVISKSGTTLEPSLAFRVLKQELVSRYGIDGARQRIFATTDPSSGALRAEAIASGYRTLDIPRGVGGRYSVLSPVGLFPLACAGLNIRALLSGAKECKDTQLSSPNLKHSLLLLYAFSRFYLSDEYNCDVEVLSSFEPRLLYFNEWWKQLFGESEGKNGQGIFPASVIYSTDLHSLGQYLQDGRRNIFETFLRFSEDKTSLLVPGSPDLTLNAPIASKSAPKSTSSETSISDTPASDGLDYLVGRSFSDISNIALTATLKAHASGGISTLEIKVEDPDSETGLSEKVLGFLIFFFEVACALSSLLHGVDPFDQPGVEKYKKEMKKLLKP